MGGGADQSQFQLIAVIGEEEEEVNILSFGTDRDIKSVISFNFEICFTKFSKKVSEKHTCFFLV